MFKLIPLLFCIISFLFITPMSYAEQGMRSVSVKKYKVSDDAITTGNYWALIVGIDKYANLPASQQLVAARKDAESVTKILIEKYGFDAKKVISLYDKDATRAAIVDNLDYIGENIGKEDSLFIYYAGHGLYSGTNSQMKIGRWLPYDGDPKRRSSQIANSTIKEYISQIPAKHILTVADSCYSGSLMMGNTRGLGGASELNDRVIKELNKRKSRWVMTSGGLYPVPDAAPNRNGHSTFAYHFVDMLKRNTNQYLPISELFSDVRYKISIDTNAAVKASPLRGSGDDGGEFIFANANFTSTKALRKSMEQAGKDAAAEKAAKRLLAQEKVIQEKMAALEAEARKMKDAQAKRGAEMEAREKILAEKLKRAEEAQPEVKRKRAFVPPTF